MQILNNLVSHRARFRIDSVRSFEYKIDVTFHGRKIVRARFICYSRIGGALEIVMDNMLRQISLRLQHMYRIAIVARPITFRLDDIVIGNRVTGFVRHVDNAIDRAVEIKLNHRVTMRVWGIEF